MKLIPQRLLAKSTIAIKDLSNTGFIDFSTATATADQKAMYNYYAFGSPKPGTDEWYESGDIMPNSVDSFKYRWGFNGKEKEDDIKGEGNSLDFGARVYDSRLGRWLSLDPLQAKYPGMSPFVFAVNSPVGACDPDGKDLKVTIEGDVITFSSITLITAGTLKEAQELADCATVDWAIFSQRALQDRTYKDGDKVYQVKFEMTFQAVERGSSDANSVTNAKYGESEKSLGNINKPIGARANAGFGLSGYHGKTVNFYGKEQVAKDPGNLSGNGINLNPYDQGTTIIHETFHNWGLGDRYFEKPIEYILEQFVNGTLVSTGVISMNYQPGYEDDIMGNTHSPTCGFSQTHVNNLCQTALAQANNRNTFIMYNQVDKSTNKSYELAPKEITKIGSTYSNTGKKDSTKTVYTRKS
jgi:RHS repeat-associated protein